ncbi:MAG TPA: SEC-C metal-binding domain-containing protein [Candidatus Saccharimonadales bacterium]|jgi:hypothetical protein|nr:SEC-C metal-binding domain-containing protein [Candidatus Saccharimonadales bacterium]
MLVSPVKVGRNDPCPCGSGKKYKRCCLEASHAEHDLWSRVHEAHKTVIAKLEKFAFDEFRKDVEAAWDEFYLGDVEGPYSSESPNDGIFVPYFLFRWTGKWKGGRPSAGIVARTFLRQQSTQLSEMERLIIELSLQEPFSFFEVRSCHPGEGFVLRDVLTGREVNVKERSASQNLRSGDMLYAQLSPMEHITTMAFCGPLIIPPGMKAFIIGLRNRLQRVTGKKDGLTLADLVRFESDLRITYLELSNRLTKPPMLSNTDGDDLLYHTITYEVGSAQVAFDALASLCHLLTPEELLEEAEFGPDGVLRKVEVDWTKRGNRQMKSWDNTRLGNLRIEGRSLVATVNSAKRASRLRREVETRLGLAAVYKSTETTSQEELWKKARNAPAHRPAPEKTPEMQQVARDFVQRDLEAWPRKKLPILGGLTPLQAVKDAAGREIVESLLLDMERNMERMFPGDIHPDVGVVRGKLKLPARS